MDLDKISVKIQPRPANQAVDLGMRIAASWYPQLLLSYAIIFVPFLIMSVLILHQHISWLALIIWWLKPIWEKPLIVVLSRKLFGQTLNQKEILMGFIQACRTSFFADILWRRFSLSRSYKMSVAQLEQINEYGARKRRFKALEGQNKRAASWLTIVMLHIEGILQTAFAVFIIMLIPSEIEFNLFDWFLEPEFHGILLALYALAMMLVAPFYVSAGFSLYINRRTEVEGWDLEIAFKRLVKRVSENNQKKQMTSNSLSSYLVLALVTLCFYNPQPSLASEPEAAPEAEVNAVQEKDRTHSRIKEILNSDTFATQRTLYLPEFLIDLEFDDDEPQSSELPKWLTDLTKLMSESIEFILWSLVALFLILLIYHFRHQLVATLSSTPNKSNTPLRPDSIAGLDIRPDSIPTDPASQALALWQAHQHREALGLIYRATLAELVNHFQCPFSSANTEGECIEIANQRLPEEQARYFHSLTQKWLMLAYANQVPNEEKVVKLFQQWPSFFSKAALSQSVEGIHE